MGGDLGESHFQRQNRAQGQTTADAKVGGVRADRGGFFGKTEDAKSLISLRRASASFSGCTNYLQFIFARCSITTRLFKAIILARDLFPREP